MEGDVIKCLRWRTVSGLLAISALAVSLPLALPLSYLAERGVSRASLAWVAGYLTSLLPHWSYWWGVHLAWLRQAGGIPPASLVCAPIIAVCVLGGGLALNPYSMIPSIHGGARWAEAREVRAMGLLAGFVMVLGLWHGRWLRLAETLSALCIAPPGTGKTAAVVVPSILCGDGVSMVVNDVKPELHAITSGHRARLGPVLRLDWAAADDGDVIPTRWNPLSPRSMPTAGPQRDLYVDRLCQILIPDPQGGADPHWSKRGRAALAGFVHFLVSKCETGNGDGLPLRWQGREACFAMLLDWISEATLAAGLEIERLKDQDPNAALMADPVHDVLMKAVREAQGAGYGDRAILELGQLANTPDRERGSILSTMDAALLVFKNQAVRARTSVSDFDFADLRGVFDPASGLARPVTIYLCVTQQDARALGVITALFVEALSSFLIAHPPGGALDKGGTAGPFPVLFVLDEFPQLPKIQALIDGPAVGRGQKVSYLLIGQDFAQIEEKYGKTGLETLISTTAAKIVLPLNNEVVAKRFSDMVGNRTHEGVAKSRTHGWSRQANPFAVNVNRSLSGVPLIHPADFMSMPQGTHVVLLQKFANRPLRARTAFYFRHPLLRRLAFDPRTGRGPAPADHPGYAP